MTATLRSKLEEDFQYRPSPQNHDEVFAADFSVRDTWRYLIESVAALGAGELNERHKKAMRILRDDGATYNIYDQQHGDRTWQLDLLPWVIDSAEWREIEGGLQERAELFNLVLKDLYGDRELITRGIVPPEVVFGHRGFIRAAQGLRLPGNHQLILHSVDMARRSDGTMAVLGDRTQVPSGAGYALENRTVMSRVFPSLFRDSHVHALALFFQNLRQKLIELAPAVAMPRIAVLTPGPYNETYFEHAYLANYLGFSLVQSGDLVVRDNRVWMKSLDGLTRVDVILRRVDDYFCDQVELKGDSQLGVPGLLEAARAGNVAIANPLGGGVLESPALLRYLPDISRHFLGRELRLPSVRTWWCGDPDDRAHVLENIQQLVIKPVFRAPGRHSRMMAELDDAGVADTVAMIRANPGAYVAQEVIRPSRLPVFDSDRLNPRPALLRCFAVAGERSYRIMPGGLARVGVRENMSLISGQLGAISKDTWVLASEPEKQPVPLLSRAVVTPSVTEASGLPSRVVENLFWLGRYAERAENGLRLMRTIFLQSNGLNPLPGQARELLLEAVTRLTDTFPGFTEAGTRQPEQTEQELLAVILDNSRPGSICNAIRHLLACAESTQELLSSDTQRIINDIRDQSRQLEVSLQGNLVSAPEEALDPLVSSLLSLAGITHESMLRGMGWRFMDMGRRLERALQTLTLVRTVLTPGLEEADEAAVLESLLLTIEVLISYRRRYRGGLNIRNVLDLVVIDTSNPRSILYQLEQLQEHIEALPVVLSDSRELEGVERHVLEAVNLVRLGQLAALSAVDETSGQRAGLDQVCARLDHLLSESYTAISQQYFDHTAGPQQLVRQQWEP